MDEDVWLLLSYFFSFHNLLKTDDIINNFTDNDLAKNTNIRTPKKTKNGVKRNMSEGLSIIKNVPMNVANRAYQGAGQNNANSAQNCG